MLCALNSVSVPFVWVVIFVFQLESLMIDQGGFFLPGESRYVELRFNSIHTATISTIKEHVCV